MNEPEKYRGWNSGGEWGRAKTMMIRELNSQLVKIDESDLPEQEKDRLREQIENKIFNLKDGEFDNED